MTSLDDLRTIFPGLGFAVYALTPGGPVTLEIIDSGGVSFQFEGQTLAACLARAFPPAQLAPPKSVPAIPPGLFD